MSKETIKLTFNNVGLNAALQWAKRNGYVVPQRNQKIIDLSQRLKSVFVSETICEIQTDTNNYIFTQF